MSRHRITFILYSSIRSKSQQYHFSGYSKKKKRSTKASPTVSETNIMSKPTDEENTPLLSPPPQDDNVDDDDNLQSATRQPLRQRLSRYLTSNRSHYCILALVSLNTASIIAALIVRLFACEGRMPPQRSVRAERALDFARLGFSCLFAVELGVRVGVFGLGYFRSWFDCFDAGVILLGVAVGVLLEGVVGEIAAFVVGLRLLRGSGLSKERGIGLRSGWWVCGSRLIFCAGRMLV